MKHLILYFLFFAFIVGCSEENLPSNESIFQVRIAESKPADTLITMKDEVSGENLYVHREVIIDQDDIVETDIGQIDDYFVVNIYLTAAGGEKMMRATSQNIEKKAAMIVDDKVVSAPIIKDEISGRRIMINGNFDFDEAERIMSLISRSIDKN